MVTRTDINIGESNDHKLKSRYKKKQNSMNNRNNRGFLNAVK